METSIQPTATLPSSVVIGADDDAIYRTISILAIVSLVLGVIAPVSLMAPLLFAIPITGAAIALLAISRIASSGGTLIGRAAAVIGLALCIASMSMAFTRTTLSKEMLSQQARAAAIEWFATLQSGDSEKAFGQTVASRQGPPPKPPVNSPEAHAEPQIPPLETFRQNPVIRFLLDHSKEAAVTYLRDTAFDPDSRGEPMIQQLFDVDATADSAATSSTSVEVIMQRVRGFNGAPSQWLVSAYKSDDLPANPPPD